MGTRTNEASKKGLGRNARAHERSAAEGSGQGRRRKALGGGDGGDGGDGAEA